MTQVTASKKINFQDIVKLEVLSDEEEIVLVSLKSRTVRLVVSDSAGFLSAIQRNVKVRSSIPGSQPWPSVPISCPSGVCTSIILLLPGTDVDGMAYFSFTQVVHLE